MQSLVELERKVCSQLVREIKQVAHDKLTEESFHNFIGLIRAIVVESSERGVDMTDIILLLEHFLLDIRQSRPDIDDRYKIQVFGCDLSGNVVHVRTILLQGKSTRASSAA